MRGPVRLHIADLAKAVHKIYDRRLGKNSTELTVQTQVRQFKGINSNKTGHRRSVKVGWRRAQVRRGKAREVRGEATELTDEA